MKTRGPINKISYKLSQDYLKFIVRSIYDSDLGYDVLRFLLGYSVSQFTIAADLARVLLLIVDIKTSTKTILKCHKVRTDTTDSLDCLPILLSVSVFYFLVFSPLFSYWFRAVDHWAHVKITYRIVSYRRIRQKRDQKNTLITYENVHHNSNNE